jgi:hypothetical protein
MNYQDIDEKSKGCIINKGDKSVETQVLEVKK